MSATLIARSALVRRPAERMFDLVNDVAGYPHRFDWCAGAQVLAHSETEMLARLELRIAGMQTAFTTRNALRRPERIGLVLEEGPFRMLGGAWEFRALAADACKVSLRLEFEPAGRWLGSALAAGFTRVADRLVDDFCTVALREAA